MDIENGMITDIEEEKKTMSDEEYDEYMDWCDHEVDELLGK